MNVQKRRLYFNKEHDRKFAIKLIEAYERGQSFVMFGLVIHPVSIVRKKEWIEVEYKESGLNGSLFQAGLS